MVVNRRKKLARYRGSSTHGCGARKKRRGAGSRGGRGRAGTGKRAGQKKAGLPPQLGHHGFTRPGPASEIEAVNLDYFTEEKINQLLVEKKIRQENNVIAIDLQALGYEKLLGAGKAHRKLKISCAQCSAQAKKKVEAAGGEIILTSLA